MIKPADVERFYKAKGVGATCPSCGQLDWTIADPVSEKLNWSLGSSRDDGSLAIPSPSVPLLVLMCTNCFTLRTHALLPLEQWMKEHPAESK